MSRIVILAVRQTAILVGSLIATAANTALAPELIDVGGHKMEIVRAGQGGPARYAHRHLEARSFDSKG